MNHLKKSLFITTSLLFSFNFNANASENNESKPAMQRYSFSYNFNKPVNLVVKRTLETQQYIEYELVRDIQNHANHTINGITDGLVIAMRYSGSQQLLAK